MTITPSITLTGPQNEYMYKKTLGVGYEYPGTQPSTETISSLPYIFNDQIIPKLIPIPAPELTSNSVSIYGGGTKRTTESPYIFYYEKLPLTINPDGKGYSFVYNSNQIYNLTTHSIPTKYDPGPKQSYNIFVYDANDTSVPDQNYIFDNATGCLTFINGPFNPTYTGDPHISFYRYEGTLGLVSWSTSGTSGSNIYYNTGNVGIGTTNPTYTLDVSGNTTFNSFPVCSDASLPSEDSQLVNKFYVDYTISQGGGGTLLSSENTWTGTNSFNTSLPTSTITANSAYQLVNKFYVDDAISQGGGGALLSSENTWTGTSNTFTTNTYLATTSGNVGIGITNPNYTLDVSGNINIKNVSNTYAFICAGNNSFLGILAEATIGGTYNNIVQQNDTAIIVNTGSISGTGGLCLGVWNGTAGIRIDETKITMNGNVTATAFISNSDYRVKENIEPLDYTFNVDNLKPVKYNLKSSKELSTGFIAHELQEEFPFLVHGEKDGKDIQAINYSGLISILVKEIQDLKKEVSNMKDELFKLRK